MRVLAYVLLIVLITAGTLAGALLVVFQLRAASDALVIVASISVPVFVVGPALVGYYDDRSSADSSRYLRWWLLGAVVVDVAAAVVVVLATISAGAPIWVPVVLIAGAAVLLAVARPLGAVFRRTERPLTAEPLQTMIGPDEVRRKVRVIVVTFVVSLVVVSIGLVLLGALTHGDGRSLVQAVLLAGQLTCTATAISALAVSLSINSMLRDSAGRDVGRLRRFAKVVLGGKDLPLDTSERRGAVRYATLTPLAVRFQIAFVALIEAGVAFQIAASASRGDLGVMPLVFLVLIVGLVIVVIPLPLRRVRRAREYAVRHADLLDAGARAIGPGALREDPTDS